MGLFSRSSSDAESPKQARPPRQRVRLDPEERKVADRLKLREQQIGFGLAAFTVIVMVGAALLETTISNSSRPWYALLGLGVGIVFTLLLLTKNRMLASIGAYFALFPSFYSPATRGIIVVLFPLIGYAFWLIMSRTSATQAALKAKAAAIERGEPTSSSAVNASGAKPAANGSRTPAEANSRYTPPKAKPVPGKRR